MFDHRASTGRLRFVMRWVMAVFYLLAGIMHLRSPEPFMTIVPSIVPWAREVVLMTGICEILGSLALVAPAPRLRQLAGIMLAAYAVCVFPANLKHAFEGIDVAGLPTSWWYHGPRLALQPVFVWWALYAGAVIDWPFSRRPQGSQS